MKRWGLNRDGKCEKESVMKGLGERASRTA